MKVPLDCKPVPVPTNIWAALHLAVLEHVVEARVVHLAVLEHVAEHGAVLPNLEASHLVQIDRLHTSKSKG